MSRSDRLVAIAVIAGLAALLLLTDLRSMWARAELGWAAPWGLWAVLIAAGGLIAALAPRDDG